MKYTGTRIVIALWLAFMVATVGPAVFGDMLVLTTPVTCPGGEINVQSDVYHPHPGETVINRTPLCTSAEGVTKEVPTLLSLIVIFAYALLPSWLLMLVIPSGAFSFLTSQSKSSRTAHAPGQDRETLARLNELKEAYDGGLITKEEYDQQRKEIVKGM